MLRGGYHRGSNVLISGAPGTAKSTLAGLFAAAACERGERTLYVSFDEGAAQIVRNLRSVGIQLAPHLKSGLLKMYSTRTRGPNIEDQFGELRAKVRAHSPRCLVIDPLSALSTKVAHVASADAAQQFLDFLKGEGITVVNTSLMDGLSTDEATATGISTIADTWIHVSYVVQDGERNRALTIVKSRGTGHSNQVRELTLSDDGVTLTDVFVAQGKVLMGVARWEWEQEEQAADEARPGRGGAQAAAAAARAGRGRRATAGRPDGDGGAQRRDRGPGRRHRIGVQASDDRPRGAAQDASRRRGGPRRQARPGAKSGASPRMATAEAASMAKAGTTEAAAGVAPLRRGKRAELAARDRQRQGDLRRALRRRATSSRSSTCSSTRSARWPTGSS